MRVAFRGGLNRCKKSFDATDILSCLRDRYGGLRDQFGCAERLGDMGEFRPRELGVGIGMTGGKQGGDVSVRRVPRQFITRDIRYVYVDDGKVKRCRPDCLNRERPCVDADNSGQEVVFQDFRYDNADLRGVLRYQDRCHGVIRFEIEIMILWWTLHLVDCTTSPASLLSVMPTPGSARCALLRSVPRSRTVGFPGSGRTHHQGRGEPHLGGVINAPEGGKGSRPTVAPGGLSL
jgi:hypothetical protein